MNNRWHFYCEGAYDCMNARLYRWRIPGQDVRNLTRIFYAGVFDCGLPQHTGLISERAYDNILQGKKVTHDHYLSPQFIARMIYDNPEKYLNDYDTFTDIFWKSTATVKLTKDENDILSKLTVNDSFDLKVLVPTDKKYDHIGIKLLRYHKTSKRQSWKDVSVKFVNNSELYFPPELLEYEEKYLV